ncbi:MAG: T9SS type A sorting domain-containing protein [Fimbriimonadaceae bacterium]|nr:T9SS type A sorting domain-containing protein [Chitinophagales bacterium]
MCAAYTQSTIIGTTTYDVQTNNGSKNHVIAHDDGTISAAWTGSTDATSAFADRGTFYNYYDGTDWGAYPTTRVESVRTGFGEITRVDDHEIAISHYFTGSVYTIQIFANDAIGGTTWTETAGSDDVSGLWAFSDCPLGTDDVYIITANANPPTALYFSRSDDGGETWAVLNYTLPYLTSTEGIPSIGGAADSYQIRVNGADVYVLFGMVNSDLVLLHSDDYGNDGSWESITVLDFPYDNFTGAVQTDIDADLVTDTIGTADGYHEMLITDDGTVHVFSGYIRLYSDGFGFYTLNFRASGIWHWSSGMAGADLIDTEIDWSGDGNPYGGIGYVTFNYRNAAVSSCPAASWDASDGRLYLLYTMKIEYTDIYDDPLNFSAESFRDLFGMYSDDGGSTWTTPENLTNTAESGEENFFVCASDRVIDGKVHATWQQDDQPGHFNEGDAIHTNNILHEAFTEDDFADEVPACDATVGPGGLYADGISATGATLHWDAVELASKYVVNIFRLDAIYTKKTGSYTNSLTIPAALIPETTYGFRVKTVCYEEGIISPYGPVYYFTTAPLKEGEFGQQINVYPNPAQDIVNVELGDNQKGSIIELYNMLGEKMNVTVTNVEETISSIDVHSLPSGTYLLKVTGNDQQIHSRIVIE